MPSSQDDSTRETRNFACPRVVLSKCLEVEPVRYNGEVIHNSFVARLMEFVELLPVCPEVEIGLGVPRPAVRLIDDNGQARLVQPKTDRDVTEQMQRFTENWLGALGEVDGFVLKAGSPSCGTANVKVYQGAEKSPWVRMQPGMFAEGVLQRFPELAVEDEGRLRNFYIRHHFLTRLFTAADLRRLGDDPTMAALIDFHRRHKHLLMLYDEQRMRRLGRLVANEEGLDAGQLYERYEIAFRKALARQPGRRAHLNVLQHIYGHFKDRISDAERQQFQRMVDEWDNFQLTLNAPLSVIRSWSARFDYDYMADQSYIEPYPRGLFEMRDSGKGFDF